ncbi:MAG: GntR family transcriptional regulator [Desulfohalobiaceae bacterium]|nr:GntR family transcriptional regulator [Desulfohalobiaceae bacterium]
MPKTEISKNQNEKSPKKKQFSEVLADLERMILTGVFKPRERLVENNLSQILGASRYWIRDALKILEARGLVSVVPYKGAFVNELSEKEVEEIFVIRKTLEQLAGEMALENVTNSDIKHLRGLVWKVRECYEGNVFEEMIAADKKFHHYLFNLSRNETLVQMIVDLRKRCQILSYTAWSSPEVLKNVMEEHVLMVDALEEKDRDKLNGLAEKHISHAKNFYLSLLNTSEAISSSRILKGL